MNAYEQGLAWGSCPEALEARKALGPEATQADWWRACERRDWLLWQLEKLSKAEYISIRPALNRAVEKIITRAIHRGQKTLRGVKTSWATEWRRWARRWLSGEDRSSVVAGAGAEAIPYTRTAWAVEAAALAAEAATAEAAAAWAVNAAVWAAETANRKSPTATKITEQRAQARDIHFEIPKWPGGEG